jgi:ABC-type Mn2+/Zn2+ transport system ATPase subunit
MNNLMKQPIINFQDVTLGYGKRKILKKISFSIYQGDALAFVGPNGSGKTTLLRALLGIISPKEGTITRHETLKGKLHIGYVPQRENVDSILPYNVYDVVLMGRFGNMGLFKIPTKKDRTITIDALRNVQMEDLVRQPFNSLSGGQKQRTLIARALAVQPNLLVLDEPTNGMDITSRTAILELIKKLHSEQKITIVLVSHLLSDVANYVDRIALLEKEFFQIGSTDEILTEENLSRLYRLDVHVGESHGRKIISAGVRND